MRTQTPLFNMKRSMHEMDRIKLLLESAINIIDPKTNIPEGLSKSVAFPKPLSVPVTLETPATVITVVELKTNRMT